MLNDTLAKTLPYVWGNIGFIALLITLKFILLFPFHVWWLKKTISFSMHQTNIRVNKSLIGIFMCVNNSLRNLVSSCTTYEKLCINKIDLIGNITKTASWSVLVYIVSLCKHTWAKKIHTQFSLLLCIVIIIIAKRNILCKKVCHVKFNVLQIKQ